MITPDGWFDWAERHPGPPEKLWGDVNALQGVVFHSAVGSLEGVINIVMGPASNNRSVTGAVGYDGRFVQFYPVTASPWANGSHLANRSFLGFENEGGVDKPATVHELLTEEQIAADVRILNDLAEYKGVDGNYWYGPFTETDTDAHLYEHNQMVRFGGSPTACPSGRIPWNEIQRRLHVVPPPPPAAKVIDGIGLHFTTGETQQVWP